MSTIANTIAVAKVTSVLASRDLAKGQLFPTTIRTEPRFPAMITTERIIIEGVYSRVPTYPTLQVASDYLYDLCGKYRLAAQAIVDGGGGGGITPVTPVDSDIYPFVITSSDFSTSDTYNDTRIAGDNIMLFINEYAQQWITASPDTFVYLPAGGFTVTIPGFDANQFSYTIVVQNLGS